MGTPWYYQQDAYNMNTNNPLKSLEEMTKQVNEQNKKREEEVRAMFDQIIGMYQPGGGFGAGTEAILERQKSKDIASATGSLISSGLFGSTLTSGLGKKWEEEVGMPSRLKLEDMRYGALGSAIGQKAGFVERIENQFPDYNLMAQLYQTGASSPGTVIQQPTQSQFGRGVGPGASGITGTYSPMTSASPSYGGKQSTGPATGDIGYSYGGYTSPTEYSNAQTRKKYNNALAKVSGSVFGTV